MRQMLTAILSFLALAGAFSPSPALAEKFHFVALGDTAYNLPDDLPKWHALIDHINGRHPDFSIHVGDIWGRQKCVEENYHRVEREFAMFSDPLIYTPGDNEWVDCISLDYYAASERAAAGQGTASDTALLQDTFENRFGGASLDDAVTRLALLRRIFYPDSYSLGVRKIALMRQPGGPDFQAYPENARWEHGHVMFATVHVVGSHDGEFATRADRLSEANDRLRANVAWIRTTFEEAERNDDKAVVLAMQAALFTDGAPSEGFNAALIAPRETTLYWIAQAIREYGAGWNKPVLLINGDLHELIVDQPFRVIGPNRTVRGDNIVRLQVYGSPDLRAVEVSVDTEKPWVFGFEPLW
jgi:hypothetical protein